MMINKLKYIQNSSINKTKTVSQFRIKTFVDQIFYDIFFEVITSFIVLNIQYLDKNGSDNFSHEWLSFYSESESLLS